MGYKSIASDVCGYFSNRINCDQFTFKSPILLASQQRLKIVPEDSFYLLEWNKHHVQDNNAPSSKIYWLQHQVFDNLVSE